MPHAIMTSLLLLRSCLQLFLFIENKPLIPYNREIVLSKLSTCSMVGIHSVLSLVPGGAMDLRNAHSSMC